MVLAHKISVFAMDLDRKSINGGSFGLIHTGHRRVDLGPEEEGRGGLSRQIRESGTNGPRGSRGQEGVKTIKKIKSNE